MTDKEKDEDDVRETLDDLEDKGMVDEHPGDMWSLSEKGREVVETKLMKNPGMRLFYGELIANHVREEHGLRPTYCILVAHWIIREINDVSLLHAFAEERDDVPFQDIDKLDRDLVKFDSKEELVEALK